jgi:protein-tyrosine phosphatase
MSDRNVPRPALGGIGGELHMIDLHTHILHGLDDGARSLTQSLEMVQVAYRDGVRTMVATPHTLNGRYQNDRALILAKVQELKDALTQFAIHNSESGIQNLPSDTRMKILPGADVHFCIEILLQLEQGNVTTVGDGGTYLFVEFPPQGIPYRAEELLFQLLAKGIRPIISHPERNLEIRQRPLRYYEMIRMGCLGQVTAMSLTGDFGPRVKRLAEKPLTSRLIHFIASDAHSVHKRPPLLSAAVGAAKKIVGQEEARRMVTEYPQAVLDGR